MNAIPTPDHASDDRLANDSKPIDACAEYLLVCQAQSIELNQGSWRFTLESADGELVLEASDDEIGDLNRLTLLATVRGLESIEGASRVTLLSTNRYLIRSLSDSLPRWRENNFVWEHFGRRIDVQHADLWRRVDRALSIHRVEACLVSSRLVSNVEPTAPVRRDLETSGGQLNLRIDKGHAGVPSRTRQAGQSNGGPKDQLRRWLMGTAETSEAATARRRFSAADLCSS
ncbi:ribonuclease H family protein [Rubripirellula reticaptiva]|uniref:ribonuclease HI n=1 Tax=Rubripirellula reticaptiva TaxID=2528013 RepID=UPI0011B37934|nr:ribonuclease HI [Rubripirellula reticaptiva]